MTHPFAPLASELAARAVQYLVIGVSGANLYAPGGQAVFATRDIDLFVPSDPDNLVRAWEACESTGLELHLQNEPLDRPRDRWLAERVITNRALTSAIGPNELIIDLTLVMAGLEFDTVWRERREFVIEGVFALSHESRSSARQRPLRASRSFRAGRKKSAAENPSTLMAESPSPPWMKMNNFGSPLKSVAAPRRANGSSISSRVTSDNVAGKLVVPPLHVPQVQVDLLQRCREAVRNLKRETTLQRLPLDTSGSPTFHDWPRRLLAGIR